MSTHLEGYTVRFARPEDYDDVIAILDDVYEGTDYLFKTYHLLMQNPEEYSCVILDKHGKIVR